MRITVGKKMLGTTSKNGPPNSLDYSAIFYLNEDYEGGEINFPNFDLTIKPERICLTPAGLEHSHSVSEKRKEAHHWPFGILDVPCK